MQTSSGAAYLAGRPGFDPKHGTGMDQAVAQAAAVDAAASALLLDVRNGYPYGTVK